MNPSSPPALDSTDLRILELLQHDASLTNHALAAAVHVSPATCLRRVRRLEQTGVIEKRIAILAPDKLGAGLTVILEVSLAAQTAEALAAFSARATAQAAVQQCYQVASGGPDFVLIALVQDMPAYHALAQSLLAADANVRNVRTFFSVRRAKFAPTVLLAAG